jgi:hypothetical protein
MPEHPFRIRLADIAKKWRVFAISLMERFLRCIVLDQCLDWAHPFLASAPRR